MYFSCEGNYIDRFRNLHWCTFKVKSLIINNNDENLQKNPCCVFELQQQNTLLHITQAIHSLSRIRFTKN